MKFGHKELFSFQKELYQSFKDEISLYDLDSSNELNEYQREFSSLSTSKFKISSFDQLYKQIALSDIIFVADFHSFSQNSKNVERIIKHFLNSSDTIGLAIESIHEDKQSCIQSYLERSITENEFLDSSNYYANWKFPWKYISPLFEIAKQKSNFDIIGINSHGSLKERDLKFAKIIENKKEIYDKLFVFVGEYHLSKNKLPKDFSLIAPESKYCVIHQNLDDVYWKLSSNDNYQESTVVSFNDSEFSIQTSSPWMKYESLINWFDLFLEDDDFKFEEFKVSDNSFFSNRDENEILVEIINHLNTNLDLGLESDAIENFNLYNTKNLKPILENIHSFKNKEMSLFFLDLIKNAYSFKIPNSNIIFSSSHSVNHMSLIAGIHIHSILDNDQTSFEQMNNTSLFRYFCSQSLFSYMSAKFINPHFKCDRFMDFAEKSIDVNLKNSKDYELVIKIIESTDTNQLNKLLENLGYYDIFQASKKIGFYLADLIYEDLFTHKKAISLLKLKDMDLFISLKEQLLHSRNYRNDKKRSF